MTEVIWQQPEIIIWSQVLLDSYEKFLGKQLIPRKSKSLTQAKDLFLADFVVLSHGAEVDPILNYGNQKALELWEMNWKKFTQTPSRLTAETIHQKQRRILLNQVNKEGFISNHQGVRISSKGQRFLIENAIIWNLNNGENQYCGQAATFSEYKYL